MVPLLMLYTKRYNQLVHTFLPPLSFGLFLFRKWTEDADEESTEIQGPIIDEDD